MKNGFILSYLKINFHLREIFFFLTPTLGDLTDNHLKPTFNVDDVTPVISFLNIL